MDKSVHVCVQWVELLFAVKLIFTAINIPNDATPITQRTVISTSTLDHSLPLSKRFDQHHQNVGNHKY